MKTHNDGNHKALILQKIIEVVTDCCTTVVGNDLPTVTTTDMLGRSRAENAVMARCILVSQLLCAGYSVTTIAMLLKRSNATIRHMRSLDRRFAKTSRAYRIASQESAALCRDLDVSPKSLK